MHELVGSNTLSSDENDMGEELVIVEGSKEQNVSNEK